MPSSTLLNLENSVRREESLRYEQVRQIWDEQVRENGPYRELAWEGEDENGKTKSGGCCSSKKKKKTEAGGGSKRDQGKREEHDLIERIEAVNGNKSSVKELVDNFEAVFRAKQKVYDLNDAHFATLLNTTGLIYYCLEEYDRAVDYLERGLRLRRELAGGDQVCEPIAESLSNVVSSFFCLEY
jgi:hypothetical protein